jgi:hypothetical protein
MSEAVGYPSGANKPGGSSWASINGKLLFSFGTNFLIGNDDMVSAKFTQQVGVSVSDTKSSTNTLSVTESDTLKFSGGFVGGSVTAGSNQDWASSSAVVSTSDVSNVSSIRLFWPGGAGYKSPSSYTLADMQFYVSGGIYTQDDGTLRVSFAVPQLQNMTGSNLWGMSSPYITTPDPGLLLPWRYTWSGSAMVTNTTAKASQIRGVDFSDYSYGALTPNTPQTVTFRVFNYSFKNADAFTYDAYYQVKNSGTDLPDISKATKLGTYNVPAIPGRSDNINSPSNWHDASFNWTTPAQTGSGYLHIRLNPVGTQLSTSNDSGYTEVGIYNASDLGDTSGANALETNAMSVNALAARANAREDLVARGVALTIESIKITDEDGNELQEPLPLDRPFELAVTVRLDGMEKSGLPIVKVNLYVNGLPVGSQHIPYLASGESRTITMTYDPSAHAGLVPSLNNLTVRVFSELMGFNRDREDSLSHTVQRKFAAESGGGCDAGLAGSLAVFGALGAALLAWKKRG